MPNEETNQQSKEQFRVVIDREANQTLEHFVAQMNNETEASKVTKSDIANYVFSRLNDLLPASEIVEIRARYFDARKALEGILKGAGSGEELPQNLREAVLKHCGIKPTTKEKRTKKLCTPNGENS